MFILAILLLDHIQFTLIHGPNIPGSYAILFFIALDFAFTNRYFHNWVSFLIQPMCLILSGDISNCLLLFPSSILDVFQPGGLIFWYHNFLPFHIIHRVLMARILEWFVISSTSGPHFVRTLHYDLSMLVGPAWHGTQFHWVTQALHHNKAVIHEGGKDMNSQLFKLSQIVDSFLLLLLLLFSLHEWGVCEEARFCNSVFLNKLQHFSEGSCVQLKAVPIVFFFFLI